MKNEHLCSKITTFSREKPGKNAIIYGDETISYLELEKKSNQIANCLYKRSEPEHSHDKNRSVLILLDRSPELIQSILGVLKTGKIFVPTSPQVPGNRINRLLEETKAQWLISSPEYYEKCKNLLAKSENRLKMLLVNSESTEGKDNTMVSSSVFYAHKESHELEFKEIYNKNCYIYFTSGSTGIPRAVLGRHRSLSHFIEWEIAEFNVNEDFNISQLTFPSFDPYLRDIFVPLLVGASCFIPKNDVLLNPIQLKNWIDRNKITLMHMVPSLFKVLVSVVEEDTCFGNLKFILLAGEMLRGKDIAKFTRLFKDRIQLVNLYGPTETTLAKFFYRIQAKDAARRIIPVGKPIKRAEAMILDENKQRCLQGNIGEVYIRTPYISSGYFNTPALTKEVFIKNPFTNNPRDIIYKSGDLGKILPDGNLELIGRMDHQVKIGGMKIEPREIEHYLLEHSGVADVVVNCRDNGDAEPILSAYIVPEAKWATEHQRDGLLINREFKEFLANQLPHYMVPRYFILVPRIPLTSNGKIDREALPEPEKTLKTSSEYEAPRNENEEKLVEIWCKILKMEKVGINDDFFELGGKSLDIMLLTSEISKEFQVEISMVQLFKSPKIKDIAKSIIQEKYVEEPAVLFNNLKPKKIHCFPPSIGYSLAYRPLASYLKDYSLYAFNFIEEEDRLTKYVKLITDIQPSGNYVLFGWSAGGSLVFDVARELEKSGCCVSDIILIDSSWNELVRDTSKIKPERVEESDISLEAWIEEVNLYLERMGIEYLKEKVEQKIRRYLDYYSNLNLLETVNANVHFIASVERETIKITAGWNKFTTKDFIIYNGFGRHEKMFYGESGEKNAKIVKHILDKIFNSQQSEAF